MLPNISLMELQTQVEQMDEWERVAVANIARRGLSRHDADAMVAKVERAVKQRINELIQRAQ